SVEVSAALSLECEGLRQLLLVVRSRPSSRRRCASVEMASFECRQYAELFHLFRSPCHQKELLYPLHLSGPIDESEGRVHHVGPGVKKEDRPVGTSMIAVKHMVELGEVGGV